MLGHHARRLTAAALILMIVSTAGAGEVYSTMRNVNAVIEAHGYSLAPANDVTPTPLATDLSPAQAFEIIRPMDRPVTIGRLFTSCSCIQLEAHKRTFQPGERAILILRNTRPTPAAGQMYHIFVQITRPVRTTLRYDTFVRSGANDNPNNSADSRDGQPESPELPAVAAASHPPVGRPSRPAVLVGDELEEAGGAAETDETTEASETADTPEAASARTPAATPKPSAIVGTADLVEGIEEPTGPADAAHKDEPHPPVEPEGPPDGVELAELPEMNIPRPGGAATDATNGEPEGFGKPLSELPTDPDIQLIVPEGMLLSEKTGVRGPRRESAPVETAPRGAEAPTPPEASRPASVPEVATAADWGDDLPDFYAPVPAVPAEPAEQNTPAIPATQTTQTVPAAAVDDFAGEWESSLDARRTAPTTEPLVTMPQTDGTPPSAPSTPVRPAQILTQAPVPAPTPEAFATPSAENALPRQPAPVARVPERDPNAKKPVQMVSLITVGVRDMQRSIRFYEALGWRRAAPNKYDQTAFFQLQGQILALYPIMEQLREQNMPNAAPQPGGITLALHVHDKADVWAVYQRFVEAGGTSLRPPAEMTSGAVTSYVADPDGNPWEISWVPQFRFDENGGLWLP